MRHLERSQRPFSQILLSALLLLGNMTMGMPLEGQGAIESGDVNADGIIDVTDVVDLAGFLLSGEQSPLPRGDADANADGAIGAGDLISLLEPLVGRAAPASGNSAASDSNSVAQVTLEAILAELDPLLSSLLIAGTTPPSVVGKVSDRTPSRGPADPWRCNIPGCKECQKKWAALQKRITEALARWRANLKIEEARARQQELINRCLKILKDKKASAAKKRVALVLISVIRKGFNPPGKEMVIPDCMPVPRNPNG